MELKLIAVRLLIVRQCIPAQKQIFISMIFSEENKRSIVGKKKQKNYNM